MRKLQIQRRNLEPKNQIWEEFTSEWEAVGIYLSREGVQWNQEGRKIWDKIEKAEETVIHE